MHKDKKDILSKGFKSKLEDFEIAPSSNVWSRIEQDLQPETKVIRPIWKYIGSAAASVAVVLSVLFGLNRDNVSTDNLQAETRSIKKSIENTEVITQDAHSPLAEAHDPLTEEPKSLNETKPIVPKYQYEKSVSESLAESKPVQQESENLHQPIEEEFVAKELIAEHKFSKEEEKESVKELDENKTELITIPDLYPADPWAYEEIQKIKRNNDWAFSLAYGNQGPGSDPVDKNSLLTQLDNFSSLRVETPESEENIIISDTHYKIPITLSFNVRKNLTDKLAIESGLSYTYLETTEKRISPSGTSFDKEYRMNYLGIPVKLVYSLYDNNRLSVYTSVGGMVEKSIYAQEVNSEDQSKNKLSIKEPQWSVSGNVGLNYKFLDHLALFVEPGVAYYFDNKSDVPTIRNDKPFNFNLQLGVRLMY